MDELLKSLFEDDDLQPPPKRQREKDFELVDDIAEAGASRHDVDFANKEIVETGERGAKKNATIKRLSSEARTRLEELGCDPLELSVNIAQGKALTKDHPHLPELVGSLRTLRRFLPEVNRPFCDEVILNAQMALTDSFVPLDIRSRHISDLIGYLYPKKKSTEHNVKRDFTNTVVSKLSKKEVRIFNSKFTERY